VRRLIAAAALLASCPATPVPAATPDSSATVHPCPTITGAPSCVLPTVARNLEGGMSWADNTLKSGEACGVSSDIVTSLWLAHTQAESIEGFVPKPQK
jgi:hypothetical protein